MPQACLMVENMNSYIKSMVREYACRGRWKPISSKNLEQVITPLNILKEAALNASGM